MSNTYPSFSLCGERKKKTTLLQESLVSILYSQSQVIDTRHISQNHRAHAQLTVLLLITLPTYTLPPLNLTVSDTLSHVSP